MDATLDEELTERQFATLEEQLSNLAREVRGNPSDLPTSIEAFSPPPPSIHELANWRYVAFAGSLLAVSIGFAAWWWSSSVQTEIMTPSDAASPAQVAPIAITLSDLAQQLQPIAHEIAVLSERVEQLKVRQDQLVGDNENLARQLKASLGESARNDRVIDQIKADQIEMARESQTLSERLNASQEQLASVIANASEPKVILDQSKVSPEEPRVRPDLPVPRPRPPTDVAQTPKPAAIPARPLAKKPQPSSAWPWSVR